MQPKRRLVICSDGTWNRPDEMDNGQPAPTNVSKLADAVLPFDSDGTSQIVYYHTGVGSEGDLIDHVAGGTFGIGIDHIIESCYRFLVQNYAPNDEIWLFGFSRGAYIVRSLVGLIRNSGLLNPGQMSSFGDALALYRRADPASAPDDQEALQFRGQHKVRQVEITFLGVWDTVGALGIPRHVLPFLDAAVEKINSRVSKYEFHDSVLSKIVRNAFHAVAVDEHRKPFEPTLWTNAPKPGQRLEQVWFAGVHSNIGGGYSDHGLSDISFAWMVQQAAAFGLATDVTSLAPNPMGVLRNSMSPLFRIFGELERQISPGVAGQRIDETVLERWQKDPSYRPQNLPTPTG